MLKKIFKKSLFIFISCMILTFFISFNDFSLNVYAQVNEDKIYSNATIDDEFTDNRVMVVLNNNASQLNKEYSINDFKNINCINVIELNDNDDKQLVDYNKVLCLEFDYHSKYEVLNSIDLLMKRDDVLYAGPDYILGMASTTSNDSYKSLQWAIDDTNLPQSWDISTGTSDIIVGIMDSGIDSSHPEFQGLINIGLSRDFTSGEEQLVTSVSDPCGHGTHVAGIIGAKTNNNLGISGVNWNIQLASLRVFNEIGIGSTLAFSLAVQYATKTGIKILNYSGGWEADSTFDSEPYKSIINSYPGLLVVASGNSYLDNDINYVYPANLNCKNLITVGAYDSNNKKCDFSNYGKNTVDLFAPGSNILSTFPLHLCENDFEFEDGTLACELQADVYHLIESYIEYYNEEEEANIDWEDIEPSFADLVSILYPYIPKEYLIPRIFANTVHYQDGYHYSDGTSMAAPYVTGVASLILSKYPHLSGAALKEIIMNGVEIVYDDNNNSTFGNLCVSGGKLDAYQSLNTYKTLTKNVEIEVINNLNDGKGLFGFSYYGSGFVDITMNAVIQNATPLYPYGSFRLLNSKGEVVKKYEMTDYSDEAINKNGYNTLSVFLPESGYYYIDVNYDVENLSSLKLLVENNDVYSPSVNLFNYNDYQEFSIDFIDSASSVDYFKQITLKQAASFEFNITLNGSARFVVLERSSSSASSGLTVIENEVITGNNTIELDLSHGTYYIGYFDLSQGSTFGLTMNRFVTESGNSLLITDPDQYTNCGSQITVAEMNTHVSNRSYRQNTIIEGFTRIIYLGNGNSRQAYYWYSSNENVATVSEFGTVFAQNVAQDTTVKIMAVYKTDPSIVYIKEFRILSDTKTYGTSPLDIDGITLNVHAGKFTYITFGDKDVPINWLQYYSWESSDTDKVSVDGFGRIYAYSSAIGGTVTITGIYNYNTRVKITITVNIIE